MMGRLLWQALVLALVGSTPLEDEVRRILLFWPVDNAKRTVAQVKKNVQHIKGALGQKCCDVFLAHYQGSSDVWVSPWYRENVVGNITGRGYKFKFMRDAYQMAAKSREESWESKYDFVWSLDSDLDLTGTNITKLFRVNWVKPSFVKGKKGHQKHGPHAVKKEASPRHSRPGTKPTSLQEQMNEEASRQGDVASTSSLEELQSSIWIFERPSAKCDYRHTDFVELTAPLMTPQSLGYVFNNCTNCIHDSSDWGLDMVWCKFLTKMSHHASSCSLIDATPVKHLNWRQAKVSKAFLAANRDVWHRYRKYWSGLKTLSCVVVDPAVKVDKVEELELPGHRHLIRKDGRKQAATAVALDVTWNAQL